MLPQDMVGIFHDVHEHIHCTVAVSHTGFFQQFGYRRSSSTTASRRSPFSPGEGILGAVQTFKLQFI
jgi:hypothetical protein